MTNKRKSMNTVDDVHAISTEGAQPLRSNVQRVSGMLP